MRQHIDIIRETGASIVEEFSIPPRQPRALPIPSTYAEGPTGEWLRATVGGDTLWSHQSLALEEIAKGKNVVVSTATASGKSLIFLTPAVHEIVTGTGKTLIFYPQKALGGDQYLRVRAALRLAGVDDDLVGEINGAVPTKERDAILDRSRIILATPDVGNAWMMSNLQTLAVQRFLKDLRFLVIDEAHAMDGLFGTASALFIRRLRSAHHAATEGAGGLQIVATTATMLAAARHLNLLTGCPFVEVGEEDNGAPFHGLTVVHVDGPATGAAAEKMLAEICSALAEKIAPNAFIAFADSRQGVERTAHYIDRDDVLPYRAGFEAADRKAIEAGIRDGCLLGAVSTAALELGIDFPQFVVGLNLGVPQTRRALRQRVGRIGRSQAGVFVLIAPGNEFWRLGGSFREYLESDVEPSHLYLENRFIQFQAASCLLRECSSGDDTPALPDCVDWPEGFAESFSAVAYPASRPRDLDQIAALGSDSPHHAYPLRAMCDVEYALRSISDPHEPIGKIEREKALREASPGATYRHLGRCYRVLEWRNTTYDRAIMLQPVKNAPVTHPLVSTDVSVSTEPAEVIDDRLLQSDQGMMAEITMRVCDRTVGYRIGDKPFLYRDLSKTNRHMTSKHREFTTTGILIRIGERWFCGDSDQAVKNRQLVADALKSVLAREHNVAPAEIRTAHRRIALCSIGGASLIDDAIVVFDSVVGGLRLTAPLFDDVPRLLERLELAASSAPDDAMLDFATINRLHEWHSALSQRQPEIVQFPEAGNSQVLIFAPGSRVAVRSRGGSAERTVLQAEFVTVGDAPVLMYRCEAPDGAKAWVAHDQVEPLGHEWRRVLWDPSSDDITDLAA